MRNGRLKLGEVSNALLNNFAFGGIIKHNFKVRPQNIKDLLEYKYFHDLTL